MSFIGYNNDGSSDRYEVIHLAVYGRDVFDEWFEDLRDVVGKTVILRRLSRLAYGNFGDHRPVGCGVWEIRIHYGPGYRIYYGEEGSRIILLICGGDKGTQKRDIQRAQQFWTSYLREK